METLLPAGGIALVTSLGALTLNVWAGLLVALVGVVLILWGLKDREVSKVCDRALHLIETKHDASSTFPIHSIQAIQEAGAEMLSPARLATLCRRIVMHRKVHPFAIIERLSDPKDWLAVLRSANNRAHTLRTADDVRAELLFHVGKD